jgi:hypothetical protein
VDSNVSAACLEQEFQKKFLSDACGRLSDQINKNLGCSWFNRYILLLHSMNLLPAVMSGPNDVDQNQNFYIVKVPVEQGRQPLFRRLEEGAIRRGKYEHEAVNSLAAEWLRTVVQGENLNSNPKNAVFSSSNARQADSINLLKEIGSSLDSIRLCFSALSNDHGSNDAELRWVILIVLAHVVILKLCVVVSLDELQCYIPFRSIMFLPRMAQHFNCSQNRFIW